MARSLGVAIANHHGEHHRGVERQSLGVDAQLAEPGRQAIGALAFGLGALVGFGLGVRFGASAIC